MTYTVHTALQTTLSRQTVLQSVTISFLDSHSG